MKILAAAKPNKRYENFRSLHDLTLQARLVGNKITFYETHSKNSEWVTEVKEETIKDLFHRSSSIKERPFLKKENLDFYTVLFRNLRRFKSDFNKLKDSGTKPTLMRAKSLKIMRKKKSTTITPPKIFRNKK